MAAVYEVQKTRGLTLGVPKGAFTKLPHPFCTYERRVRQKSESQVRADGVSRCRAAAVTVPDPNASVRPMTQTISHFLVPDSPSLSAPFFPNGFCLVAARDGGFRGCSRRPRAALVGGLSVVG